MAQVGELTGRKLSPAEQERGLAALAQLQLLRQELQLTYKRLASDSVLLLQEEREKRTREMLDAGDA